VTGTARLFVALELPVDVREALAEWAREVAGNDPALRLVVVDALHVTLAFLGHRAEDEVEVIAAAVRSAGEAADPRPSGLRLAQPLWLAPRRPHVLTVALEDPDGGLAALYDAVWDALAPLGFEPEKRPFLPHVTVARVRKGARVRPHELPAPAALEFTGAALTLFRSHLGGRGPARYEALERIV
jgi:2'-5' RNA ligase